MRNGIYRTFLKRLSPERELFLEIAHDIWQDFFSKPAVQDIIQDHQIALLVFEPNEERVVQWISHVGPMLTFKAFSWKETRKEAARRDRAFVPRESCCNILDYPGRTAYPRN